MRFFTTPTQRKIIRYYWEKQDIFTLDDLLEEKIIRHPALGRLTLRWMVSGWQLLSRRSKTGETVYIGSTSSEGEWNGALAHGRLCIFERAYYMDILDTWLEEHQNKFWTI